MSNMSEDPFSNLCDPLTQPLTSHATPYSLARIQSVAPTYRKKSNWYRERMDPLVNNDTRGLHWTLSLIESRRLLQAVFPDDALFRNRASRSEPLNMDKLLDALRTRGVYKSEDEKGGAERWHQFSPSRSQKSESITATFLNSVLKATTKVVGKPNVQRTWQAKGSTLPLKGSDANRKPDLVLLPVSVAKSSKDLDWRDVVAFGEIKYKMDSTALNKSYTEAMGKAAHLLYAQDGRHSTPFLRILGHHIILTFLDRGGSLSTAPFDIHEHADDFLRILLGISTLPTANLGFDETLFWDHSRKKASVAWKGDSEGDEDNSCIYLDRLVFISDSLHGRGTTVWVGSMKDPTGQKSRRRVVMKDSWVDPVRKFTEGNMLARLNDASVEGVPRFIHEQQVQGSHPSRAGVKINLSTHFLRTLLSLSYNRPYQLRVLSRLVTEPFGISIMSFSSLGELLVAFIDYVLIHKDAIIKAKILHRDISLLNLLLVLWDPSGDSNRRLDFLNDLPQDTGIRLRTKMKAIKYRGLLADWGYAVPLDAPHTHTEPPRTPQSTPPNTPSTSLVSPRRLGENFVPVRSAPGSKDSERIAVSKLRVEDEIVLSMGRDQSDPSQPSIDTNPLYRTGTWSWMAAELVMAGPGKPVTHRADHDLESLFYVLLGICVLFDAPHIPKPDDALSKCFDLYFNTFEPSLQKTVTIQSELGWSFNILRHISPYFQPLIPLLNTLRARIILPMRFVGGSFHTDVDPITHDEMIKLLVEALCNVDDKGWVWTQRAYNSPPAEFSITAPSDQSDDASSDDSSELSDASRDRTPPRMPRPPSIRQISGPGFASSSGSTRRPLSDDAEYSDPGARAAKRLRPTPPSPICHVVTETPPAPTGRITRRFAATAPSAIIFSEL